MLLDRGANPNAQLKKLQPYRTKVDRGNDTMLGAGTTPFLRAAKAGDVPAMRLLLEHGADPKLSPTRSGITPLMAAAGLGTSEQDTHGPPEDPSRSDRRDPAAARSRCGRFRRSLRPRQPPGLSA